MASLIAAALARAQRFLLEPTVLDPSTAAAPASLEPCRSVDVVVTGLSRGTGATTVAAALAAALVVPGARSTQLIALGSPAEDGRRCPPGVIRWDLPPALSDPGEIAEYGATLGRLAAGGGSAAVVWDVRADDIARGARVMEASGAVVCVAGGGAEPTLSSLVCDMLGERYGRVLLVANRVRDEEGWAGSSAICIPDSRLAALWTARGRAPGGFFAEAIARVAAIVEEQRSG